MGIVEMPIINIQKIESSKLREACEKWGCFRVVNHGVPKELMAEIKFVAIDLFNRTVEIKQRTKVILPGNGYVGPSEINQVYEGLALDITSSQCLASFCDHLKTSPKQREIIETYFETIRKLAIDIANKMTVWPAHFRMNNYNITQDNVGTGGLPTHTDASLIIILQDDEDLGGFEIVDPSGELVDVDPFPGSFLVNLGDVAVEITFNFFSIDGMLHLGRGRYGYFSLGGWSNGQFRTLQHRVICKDVGIRLSIATFLTPATEEDIVAHPKFLEGDHPLPKYAPFK